MSKNTEPQVTTERVTIAKANIKTVQIPIIGTSAYVQQRFHAKETMMAAQAAGSTNKKGSKKTAKDFEALFKAATHRGMDGKYGIPAAAFRAAAISACRLVGFKMTLGKLSIFIVADTIDNDGTPLVHMHGEPKMHTAPVRLPNGSMDIRARPMWLPGWKATVMVQFDADQFTLNDVYNLFERIGTQVGIGEGRNDSRNSTGCGWGSFAIDANPAPPQKAARSRKKEEA